MYPISKTVITALLGLIMPFIACAQTADYPNRPIR